MAGERLDKLISNRFLVPRKTAKADIKAGLVTVNGLTVRDPELKAEESSDIRYRDRQIKGGGNIYIMMNKPSGVLTASTDRARATVIDLLPEELKRRGLFPVGRLDRDTTGLLIITDDGVWAHGIVAPRRHVDKKYLVTLDGVVGEEVAEGFLKGVTLADGTLCRPARLEYTERKNEAVVTLREGKYHQIKRMFGVFGLGVVALTRLSVGRLELDASLAEGESREMTEAEKQLASYTAEEEL